MSLECCVCFDDIDKVKGITCAIGHFICDDDVNKYLKNLVEDNRLQKMEKGIQCPYIDKERCVAFWEIKDISDHLDKDILANLFDRIVDLFRLLLKDKNKNIPRTGDLDSLRTQLIDTCLNLRCPHCDLVFTEFDGCLAITCQCGLEFCGFCLEKTVDAHLHARTRHHSVFKENIEIKRNHRLIRIQKLQTFLGILTNEKRQTFMEKIKEDIQDLGIDQSDLMENGGKRAPPPLPPSKQIEKSLIRKFAMTKLNTFNKMV